LGELGFLDRCQPLAPRIRVVVVVVVIGIVMPDARNVAALSSASTAIEVTPFCIGSQNARTGVDRQPAPIAIAKISSGT
jgi:hypothetical protein